MDIRQDDQDHTAELLRDGVVTAAVTAQREAVQGCRVRRLGAMRYRALATPEFAAAHFADGLTPRHWPARPSWSSTARTGCSTASSVR